MNKSEQENLSAILESYGVDENAIIAALEEAESILIMEYCAKHTNECNEIADTLKNVIVPLRKLKLSLALLYHKGLKK